MTARLYKPNSKHKRGTSGEGPPRWFPDSDSLCPDDIDMETAQELLEEAVSGVDHAHPNGRALYALHAGEFYKSYSEITEHHEAMGEVQVWHGYPVRRELVPRQIPARVLRQFVRQGRLTRAEYKKLLGSAR